MPEDALAVVRRRLHSQRLASGHFARPAEAVTWLGAMQAQEYAEAKWSIGERVDGCTDADVEQALSRGEILRTHVLRPTWHFVSPADIRWMLRLTAPRVHRRQRLLLPQVRAVGRDAAARPRVIAAALEGDEPLTRPELAGRAGPGGNRRPDDPRLRLGYILMHAELEELVCSGPRRGNQHTYARFESRVPESRELTREEALAELSPRCFRGRRRGHDPQLQRVVGRSRSPMR